MLQPTPSSADAQPRERSGSPRWPLDAGAVFVLGGLGVCALNGEPGAEPPAVSSGSALALAEVGEPCGEEEGGGSDEALSADRGSRSKLPRYRRQAVSPAGYFSMGLAAVRTFPAGAPAGPRSPDVLVIANGGDWIPQSLTFHTYTVPPSRYGRDPAWLGCGIAHHMGLSVGDVNGDGWDDLAVASLAGRDDRLATGGVEVFLGGPNGIGANPSFRASGFGAAGVTLGDVDGDGALDLIVASLWEDHGDLTVRKAVLRPPDGDLRIWLGGPTLFTGDPVRVAALGAKEAVLADADLDGDLDLVVVGRTVEAWLGPLSRRGVLDLGRPADWTAGGAPHEPEGHSTFAFGAAFAVHPTWGPLLAVPRADILTIQTGSLPADPGYVGIYAVASGPAPVQVLRPDRYPSAVALAQLGADDTLHLVVGASASARRDDPLATCFGDAGCLGSPVRIYTARASDPVGRGSDSCGRGDEERPRGLPFFVEPAELRGGHPMAADLLVTSLDHGAMVPRSYERLAAAGQSVFQLEARGAAEIQSVERVGPSGRVLQTFQRWSRTSRASDPTWSRPRGAPWLSIHPPARAGDRIRLRYSVPEDVEVVVSSTSPDTFDGTGSSLIHYRTGQLVPGRLPATTPRRMTCGVQ